QRPIDVHLAGFEAMGSRVDREGEKYVAETDGLRGARVFADYPSVLGTQNLMLAAATADGTTTIVNAASEPEVQSLAAMLNSMGARISGAGTHTVTVEGVEALHGTTYRIIPDRLEAGTFAIAAAITGGQVEIQGVHLDALVPRRDRDIVIECSGSPVGLELALQLVRPRGTIVLKSTYAGLAAIDLSAVVIDEVRVIGSRCGPFPEAIDALARQAVDVRSMISRVFSIDKAIDAFAAAADPENVKVLLKISPR
ncbi:MAG: hypothetical protein IH987_02690, partial [Planctomycetes bacterium]|nr:hypothetical protein [Planctomycetota bacterium]